MKHFMHKEGGYVASFDDDEKPSLLEPSMWQEVHLHAGPSTMHREPSPVGKAIALVLVFTVAGCVVSAAIAGAYAAWSAVLG